MGNENLLSDKEKGFFKETEWQLIQKLLHYDQSHLFAEWNAPGLESEPKKEMLQTLIRIDSSYPGGIGSYIENSRKLLQEAKERLNPYSGFQPERPAVVDYSDFSDEYWNAENTGVKYLHELVVVMVAGGLGERLGYPGIKIDIPVEISSLTSYLKLYASYILAMGKIAECEVPFVIMTSNETHEKTVQSLKKNNYFNLSAEQVYIIRQELVPAISDNQARIALAEKYKIILKPHGHGDIHILLHTSGLAAKFLQTGKKFAAFIQDTNGQVFNAVIPMLGVSKKNDFDFNSLGMKRIPKEAVGAIATLVKGPKRLTLNVEYNQLDALLRETIQPDGDVADASGFSPFPGNANVLMVKLESYTEVLKQTQGIIAEFVNPKYADEARESFKKPTRLETMMQDYPKLLTDKHKIGVTVLDRKWSFSPDKNNLLDAADKAKQSQPPESAATAESDYYFINRKKLTMCGVRFDADKEEFFHGVPFIQNARVVLSPLYALTVDEMKKKLKGGYLEFGSTLVIDGEHIYIEDLHLTAGSALILHTAPDVHLKIKGVTIRNQGMAQRNLTEDELKDEQVPAYLKIRGYTMEAIEPLIVSIQDKGHYALLENGVVVKQ